MRFRSFLTAIMLLIIAAPNAVLSAAQQQSKKIDRSRALRRMMIPGTEDLQLIIELSDPALLERMKGSASARGAGSQKPSERNRRMNFASSQTIFNRQQIRQGQESLKRRLAEIPGVKVQGTTDTLMNAVVARVPAAQYRTIQRLPGVKKVYFSRARRMVLDQAAAIQNAQNLWTAVGGQGKAGQGIKIGIIDSGIDITNPMFSGAGLSIPPGFPLYSNGSQPLTNSKVIVARSYASLFGNEQLDQTADDEVGHGTFVAGCAAGAAFAAPRAQVSGMAPGAYLGNYKILGTPGINDTTTTAAELAAIDDAVRDGMDVINLSIGALDYLPPEENAEYIALDNAVKAGVIVTISAGNDGSATHTIGSPGTIPEVITVGSVTSTREFLAIVNTSNPELSTIGYLPSEDGIRVTEDQPFTKIVDAASLDGDGLGCAAFPSKSLNGSVALIERGICTFATKVANASKAGAKTAVIYNNVPVGMVGMIGLSSATIPAIMISMTDGTSLKQYINTHSAEAQVAIKEWDVYEPVATTPRVVSSFSSVGPGTDFSIKPDLVAVGENVYSATEKIKPGGMMYDESGFTVSQGTSFSSPMVAGAAAVLLQKFPLLGALAIKSLLANTASRDLTVDGVNAPNVLQAGSGLMNMSNASAARAVFSPTSLNFGVHSYSGTLSLSAALDIENISSNSEQYTLDVEPVVAGPSISFSQSTTGAVAPGASTTVNIFLGVDAPATGGFQGFITVRDSSSSMVYRIPYWAGLYVPDPSRVLRVTQNGSGSGYYSSLAGAIAAAQPGNIIEIGDDGVYPSGADGLKISTNGQGLPLHGLTIRAATGRSPVIEAAEFTSGIMIIGVKDVLLQGLQIIGGYTGIELYQPSSTVPLSATIDQCAITFSSGGYYASGIWIDGGGTVDITRSAVKYSSGPGIVAGLFADGTQLTIIGTTVEGNEFDGMEAYGANLYVSGSAFTGNFGSGLYLEQCTGTVAGSTISQNTSYFYEGDGIVLYEGNVTLKDNVVDSNDGVGILSGADLPGFAVKLEGNTVRGQMQCGVTLISGMSLLADGNLVEDNACGVYLDGAADTLLLNNIISGSYNRMLGDGIEIAGGTNARMVNNTIYDNELSGVLLTDGSVTVENCIVYMNAGGDLVKVPPASVRSSLISSNPNFVNAAAGDFTPAPGSIAIDAGSNTASDLPFLDYHGRLRVSSANVLPGNGKVDVGAIETDSAYPLAYPLTINGPDNPMEGVFRTGIAFTNPGNSGNQFHFTAYNGEGGYLSGSRNPAGILLPSQSQLAILDYELFGFSSGLSSFGSVLGSSDSDSAGFFMVVDEYFRKFATGANSSQAATDLVFMRHRSDSLGHTRYAVFNPGIRSVDITATLYDSEGTSAGLPQPGTIPAKGSLLLDFDSRQLLSGYVRVRSDGPVAGVQITGNENLVSVLGAFSPDSQTRLFFPHLAVGGHYSSEVGIINTSELSANLDIGAYDDSGKLLGRIEAVTEPGGQFLESIAALFGISEEGDLRTGYLVVHSTQPGIMGFTNYSYTKGDRRAEAFMPANSSPTRRLFFSHVAHGVSAGTGVPYQTGIALLNPFGTDVGFTISVYDGAGNLVGRDSQTVRAHEKLAKILTYPVEGVAFFTQDLVLGNGHVEVTTDYGLIGAEFFFTEDVSQMSSVPAQISK